MLIIATFQVDGSSYNYSTFTVSKFDSSTLPAKRGGPFYSSWDASSPYRTFTLKTNGILIPDFPETVKALYLGQYDSAYVSTFGIISGAINPADQTDAFMNLFLESTQINQIVLHIVCAEKNFA